MYLRTHAHTHTQSDFYFFSLFFPVRLLCGLGAVSLRNQALTSIKGMPVVEDMVELYLQNNLLQGLVFQSFFLSPLKGLL
jgi:hypothetical protein